MTISTNDFVDDPTRQCQGKKAYSTKARGKTALRRLPGSAANNGRSSLHVYRCPHCGSFHIGTKAGRKVRDA